VFVRFSKYHGTGNDFIIVDGRSQDTSGLNKDRIGQLCNRRLGIGADGLIILEETPRADFRMRYFNADGNEGTMCGNGGRCITRFAQQLGLVEDRATFEGIDGMHTALCHPDGNIRLKLSDVDHVEQLEDGYLLNTGSPHFVTFQRELDPMDVEGIGRAIRNQTRFGETGVNVNFVTYGEFEGRISVRTYERGVEAETLSCGTGVTASAICSHLHHGADIFTYVVWTRGGELTVDFKPAPVSGFTDIYLTGPAVHVFDGTVEIQS
jgi:diaminopimelate epimerase